MSTVYSVTRLNNEIKDLLDAVPGYRNLFVQGEISNYKAHSSGHYYLTLKDEGASISAVMFRSDAMRLKFRLENGMKVIVRGRVSSFPRTGQVQLYLNEIVPDGAGALNLAFEQLKSKLHAEGLFNEAYKKPIPACPSHVALITSPTGAAVRDMVRILGRRWPLARVTLYPSLVQGPGAAPSICRALALANAVGEADVILCGRGGGSMEDLWAFNEEAVARAIFESEIPVISAVGHEPDVTIADFVADLRAPTPSGAAELAVPDRAEYRVALRSLELRLHTAGLRHMQTNRRRLDGLAERLAARTPAKYIDEKRLQLDSACERLLGAQAARLDRERQYVRLLGQKLSAAGQRGVQARRLRFSRLVATLDAISPLGVLARGYAIAEGEKGVVVDAAALHAGDRLRVRFAKGVATCSVLDTEKGEA
ncbi:exodeoxyribonuclease VII large subunit [Butyricicoccus faecihominis]|uniref:exodeoxyribonuclease VII large subunit n=1 Tax=Butyricicoccus faecihominis TaxID=1712515 RepID=UPI0024794E3F|nr:exodeoxyribonuclease VII large subunit [Butyricicoccus faecihominis]MCQ5130207.1 exodeoxyribonuclease VII large subunit [Butyricicoccus faecihominis]